MFPTSREVDEILVGPDSVVWQRVSDVRLNLVIVYALLLQVAHPTVGAGVSDYSDFELRPWTRLLRTANYLTVLVYGGEEALDAGRRLRQMHRRFKGVRPDGESYHALEPRAYAWVHATLIESYVAGHAHFGSPMSPEETERFYAEYRGLGRLIGVRDRDLPDSWAGFCDYFEWMGSEVLVANESVGRVLRAIRRIPPPPGTVPDVIWNVIRLPAADAVWLGGVGPMPPALRDRLGISWSWHDEARFRALGVVSRSLGAVMPPRMKVSGPAQLDHRRAAVARGAPGTARGAQWLTAAAASSETSRSS